MRVKKPETEAICPRCRKTHGITDWTGDTKPRVYCPRCRSVLAYAASPFNFESSPINIPMSVKPGIRPGQ